ALAGASPATDPGAPAPRPEGRLGRLLVPVVALLVGAGLAALVLQAVTPTVSETTAATAQVTGTASAAPDALVLARADFVGRPVDSVRAQLEAMGLQVRLEEVETAAADPDTVVDVAPLSVRLQAGQTVLVSYAVAPAAGSRSGNSSRVPGEAVVQAPATTTSSPASAPAPTPTATPTPTPTVDAAPTTDPVDDRTGDTTGEDGDPGSDDEHSGDGDPGTVTSAPTSTSTAAPTPPAQR
ncbi:MAG TPA: serine/threonine protein kinase, partial [Modestobacter sp.]|nr:serine/threonine protein kinase [Modestobacter sp.]